MDSNSRVQMDVMFLKILVLAFKYTFWIEIWLLYERVMVSQRLFTFGSMTTECRCPTLTFVTMNIRKRGISPLSGLIVVVITLSFNVHLMVCNLDTI